MPPNRRIDELEDLGEATAEDLVIAQRQGRDGYVSLSALVGLLARVDALEHGINRRPTLALVADHTTVDGGAAVKIRAIATDPEGEPLTYQWTQDKGALAADPETPGDTVRIFTAPDATDARQMASVTCTVTDPEGGRATRVVEFIVRSKSESNLPPAIVRLTASLDRVAGGGAVVITAVATDPEGENLSFDFATDLGAVTAPPEENGKHIVADVAPDQQGQSTAQATVTAPVALPDQEQTITVTCTVEDPEGEQAASTVEVVVAGRAAGALIYAAYGADQTVTPPEFLAGTDSEDEDGRVVTPVATQAGYLKFALSVDHFGRAGDMREEGGLSDARRNFIPAAGDPDVVITIDGRQYYAYVENSQTAARFSGGTWIIQPA